MRALALLAGVAGFILSVNACSSGAGGGGAAPCSDAGTCPSGLVCENGFCVTPGGTGATSGAGGTGATSGSGGGGTGGGGDLCTAGCNKVGQAQCSVPHDQGTCVADCQSAGSQYPQCNPQYQSLLNCAVQNGTPGCTPNGEPTLDTGSACDAATSAYSDCVIGGTGGTGGGSGGFGGTGGGFGGTGGGFGGTGGGFGGSGGGTGGAGTCTSSLIGQSCSAVSFGTAACDNCMFSNCCNVLSTCYNTNDCGGLLECISLNCANATDVNTCSQQYCSQCLTSAGVNAFNAIGTCIQNYCNVECQ